MRVNYARNTGYYIIGPLARYALAFVSIPILTRRVLPADFGVVNMLVMIGSFGSFAFLGVNAAVYRYYVRYVEERDSLSRFFSTNQLFVGVVGLFYVMTVGLAHPLLRTYVIKGDIGIIWVVACAGQFVLSYVTGNNQYILQNMQRGHSWLINELGAVLTQFTVTLLLVWLTSMTFQIMIIAMAAGETVRFLTSMWMVRSLYVRTVEGRYLKEALSYCWPEIPTGLLGYASNYMDKIFLNQFWGASQVGLADLATRFSTVVKAISEAVGGTTSPLILNLLHNDSPESRKNIARINTKTIFGMMVIGLGLMLFSREIIMLLTTRSYDAAFWVLPIYVLTNIVGVFGSSSFWLIFFHKEKMALKIPLNMLNLVLNLVFQIALVPRFGLVGSSVAILLASVLTQGAQFTLGMRITPIPLELRGIMLLFGYILFAGGFYYFSLSLSFPLPLLIFIKTVIIGGFVGLGVQLRFFSMSDWRQLSTAFSVRPLCGPGQA